ncbi:uncharacterized protein Mesr4 [Temnothorax nylanderi]|uniref:uncharacterized protein Mesr4 n=1 Tax=Temnothorax nylanderi TaxID=102681 RepID=UPI003A84FDE5
MEDEDGESKVIDMWNILEEQRLKDSTLGNALRHSIDDVYTAVIEEEKQLIRYNSILGNDSPGNNTIAGPKFVFKGFKKRILAEAREVPAVAPKNSSPELRQSTHPNARTGKDKGVERKRKRKITEYAQYLGLRPSTRYKCSKCHAWVSCGPNSRQNSCACNPSMTPMPSTSESSASVPHASNFKITRKVYLCSACGTYFENWNLFLHMRDIHKRHICLFCLGMFGQAERLSYHLMKKHSVPEMAFSSVEDFYNAFKGSCYLICCSCEKVFSETDDFFNHFCSPVLEQDATVAVASMCTICRQTGTHASTCNVTLSDTDKELRSPSTPLTVADTTYADNASPTTVPPTEIATNLGGKGLPRKAIKYNRKKRERDDVQNSRQQKSSALAARKLGAKVQCNENQFDCGLDVQREIANSLPRDTVTETIMEVSRYRADNSSDENDENDEQVMNKDVYNNRDKGSGGKSPVQNCQLDFSEPYDSVTETIMEVSRYTGEEDKNEREDAAYTSNIPASHTVEKMNTEDEETCDKSDVDPSHSASSRAPSPVQWDAEETATADTKVNATCETGTKYDSPQDTRSCSPVSHSVFSPQHESLISDSQPKEKENFEDVDKKKVEKPVTTNTTESQASVSFNAVASSDRSLVIKICNRNSQFSVATTTVTSRESEENNNAEGSTSKERMPNGSEVDRDIVDDDQANELDDSDSDSDKLAVVDSNPEEDEEAEDGDEGEEADEAEDRHDDAEDESQRNQEENDETKTETYTDRLFSVTETMPIGNPDETSDGNAIEGVANEQTISHTIDNSGIVLAGEDVPCIDLNVEGTLDSMELEELLKRCIEVASPVCVYCNHARYIAVNGRQLGLHMLAEHKFQPQHPAIIIHAEQFTARVKRSLDELETRYFNLDTYNSADGTYNVPNVLIYECFHCRFHSAVHKELYLHNRKMHQKTILICIMCKSTFYSYSELVCHLCPGVYSPNVNLRYRCCLCSVASLPSAFRLMVHVRKRHHACDVCLESTGNQQRLSNHVWKHKLHHLCYRCGIAYRNKPDITKHLFWKHGTESVLCRKCLQKKWPHIYHFCIPPTAFVCEECGSSFGRAVALKVHKRLHSGDLPYGCDECGQHFISRKLLAKHQAAHREPEPEDVHVNVTDVVNAPPTDKDEKLDKDTTVAATDGDLTTGTETVSKNVKEAVKRVVDVYDLPPLNLSSESDTDSEEEKPPSTEKPPEKENIDEDATKKSETAEITTTDDDDVAVNNDIVEVERNEEEKKQEARIMDGIWDNFKTYAASLDVEESAKNVALKESVPETDAAYLRSIVLSDHDYCVIYSSDKEKNEDQATSMEDDAKANETKSKRSPSPGTPSRNTGCDSDANKRKAKTPKKKKRSGSTSSTSDSSSDSDSSSCSCGTNCSCSSSSSGSSSSSSSSSDSDSSASESSPRKQSGGRKDRNKKERETTRENKSQSVEPENQPEDNPEVAMENGSVVPEVTSEPSPVKLLLRESDLETEETETDEDFYDEYPQLLANKLLAEKRNQLMLLATVAPASTPTSTPTSTLMPAIEQPLMPLNNGILVAETALPDPIAMTLENQQPQPQQQQQQQKRKTKTKKRRKGERSGKRNAITTATVESIKLNIPKALYQKNAGFVASSQPTLHPNSRSSTPSLLPAATCNDFHSGNAANVAVEMHHQQQQQQASSATAVAGVPNQNVGGSGGTDTESKRVSKRKRVPKRFYGDSSDDEPQEKQSFGRWRKIETNISTATTTITPAFAPLPPMTITTPPNSKPLISRLSLGGKTIIQTYGNRPAQVEQAASQQQAVLPEASPIAAPASATESEGTAESSSDSSESEAENTVSVSQPKINPMTPAVGASITERPGKIYCYCRCPYDEVSEMIACDGEDCRIEWFHFECVGIMVPPKGKWYCPDCRKKHGIVQNDEYCD